MRLTTTNPHPTEALLHKQSTGLSHHNIRRSVLAVVSTIHVCTTNNVNVSIGVVGVCRVREGDVKCPHTNATIDLDRH